MYNKTHHIKFITPCFSYGAKETACLKATSVIGQLRWWLRNLEGVSKDAITSCFGGTLVGQKAISSSLQIRVEKVKLISDPKDLPQMRVNQPLSYILYFPYKSGKAEGANFQHGNFIGAGSEFKIHIRQHRRLEPELQEKLEEAIELFFLFGSLGQRHTRGCGAFIDLTGPDISCEELIDLTNSLVKNCMDYLFLSFSDDAEEVACDSWRETLIKYELVLKTLRNSFKAGKNGRNLTALGYAGFKGSTPERQTSSLIMRPVLTTDGIIPFMFLAPKILHDSIDYDEFFDEIKGVSVSDIYDKNGTDKFYLK